MRIYPVIRILILCVFLASCAPAVAITVPTATPTATQAPTVVVTSTVAPKNLADLPELTTWVEAYVHAYGGKVLVDGLEMDAATLMDTIRKTPQQFLVKSTINGISTTFFVINNVPLASQGENGSWAQVTLKSLNGQTGRKMGTQFIADQMDNESYMTALLENFDYITIDGQLNLEVLLPGGKEISLIEQIRNGDNLTGLEDEFDWEAADVMVRYANENGLMVQGHHLFVNWSNLTDAVKQGLRDGSISYEDYEKFLKVYVQTIVSHFDQENLRIHEWTATNEVTGALLWSEDRDILEELFINRELMTKIPLWVKEVNPQIRTIVSEDHLFENQSSGLLDTFIDLVGRALEAGAPIDEIGIQNHLWIYSFPTEQEIDTALQKLKVLGLPISSTEITISVSEIDFFSAGVGKRRDIAEDDLLLEQAKAYQLLMSKIPKNAFFGFSDSRSCFSEPLDDAYDPTAKALILDEYIKPKPAYYAILQLLFAQLP